jgi:hypothetical protein
MACMANSFTTFRVLAYLDDRLWEPLHPHLPLFREAVTRRGELGERVTLNPQPLPPREVLRLATVQTARAVADAAIAARFAGRDPGEVLDQISEDWCATPPGRIPWPRQWPHPWPPDEPYPIVEEIDRVAQGAQAQAALVFWAYAAGIEDEELSAAFNRVGARLEEAAATPRGT